MAPGHGGGIAAAVRARKKRSNERAIALGLVEPPPPPPKFKPAARTRPDRPQTESPRRYLWRLGFGREGVRFPPRLTLETDGHDEQECTAGEGTHTYYTLSCRLEPVSEKDRGWIPEVTESMVSEEREVATPKAQEMPSSCSPAAVPKLSLGGLATPVPAFAGVTWTCSKRLCDLREDLHDEVKLRLGDAYPDHFGETPFARHGGMPGTTSRIRAWFGSLAACVNEGVLEPSLLTYVLRILEAPIPEDSDAAMLTARGRCTVCTLLVDRPGERVCARCQELREGAVSSLQKKWSDASDCMSEGRDPTPLSSPVGRAESAAPFETA
mmetsp:Transcript_81110/g.173474  ORF Transcript_81110/g.173474 Transcript_81110/m.173474 type:complete len:325 (-) Transcript_81110:55-1029(-)